MIMGRKPKRRKGRKKKRGQRTKRTRTPMAGGHTVLVLEYYQLAFLSIVKELSVPGRYSPAPSAKRRSFWQLIPPGLYSPVKGQEFVHLYLRSLEDDLRTRTSQQSIAYWLHVFRRLAPTPIGRDTSPTTVLLTRAALEAAVQKWASFALCGRVAHSDRVPPSAILKGFLIATRDEQTLAFLRAQPQLVLTDFGAPEYLAALETEKLGYEVWRSMALLRILGKGAQLEVGDAEELVHDNRSDELDTLVRHYDQRGGGLPTATATGTVFEHAFQERSAGVVVLPHYNVEGITFAQLRPLFQRFLGRPLGTPGGQGGPNFVWLPFNLRTFYEAHQPFSAAFRETHGVALESVLAVIGTICRELFLAWLEQPERHLLRLWQRAYDGPLRLAEYEETIRVNVPLALAALQLPFDPASLDVRAGVEFLTLREDRRQDIGISYSGPHYVFLPAGEERVFADYAYLWLRLYHLFHGVSVPDQNFKGDALERSVHRGESVLPTGELKGCDGTRRQVDAAFALDDILVIAECRAVTRSIAVDRGDLQALEKRKQVIEKALNDIDEKARWLASHREGTNYDVTPYRLILPVGITPFTEFISSLASRFWISDTLPRVLTPAELAAALDDGSMTAAAPASPNAVRLE
jgi:hypothetical protein